MSKTGILIAFGVVALLTDMEANIVKSRVKTTAESEYALCIQREKLNFDKNHNDGVASVLRCKESAVAYR